MATVIVPNKRAKSLVWCYMYFGFPGDDSGAITKKKVVVCRLCADNDEFPYAGNTTNVVTHLERHHKTEYSNYLEASGKESSSSTSKRHWKPRYVAHNLCLALAIVKGTGLSNRPLHRALMPFTQEL